MRISSLPSRISSRAKLSLRVWSRIFVPLAGFMCRDASQPEAPEGDFDQGTEASDAIDAGLGAQLQHADRPILGGGLCGVGGCHGDRGAAGAGANADAEVACP